MLCYDLQDVNNTLIVIDAYISSLERAFICERLISQMRSVRPNINILLLNKSGKSYGVEKKSDYYYNHGQSFMVGAPPQHLLDTKQYSRPYVFFETPNCILENWMPLVNVTDHVANIYNSFIICAKLSELLGFEKFLRVEFDTDFDIDDLNDILQKMDKNQDYLIYGLRKEGIWMGPNSYLLDVHVVGFSPKVFDNFEIVTNDEEFWSVCKRIGYYGKWIEYVIAAIFRINSELYSLQGEIIPNNIRKTYPNTKFDIVNSPGEWKNKWYEIPKLSKVHNQITDVLEKNKLGIFFYNANFDYVDIHTKLFDKNNLICYEKKLNLQKNCWMYDIIDFSGYIRMETTYSDHIDQIHYYEKEVTENFDELNCRMLMK